MDSNLLDDPLFLLALYVKRKRKKKRSQTRRWYVRPINLDRQLKSQYYDLVADLRASDQEWHREYFRMSKERYDMLVGLVGPYLVHKKTHKMPVSIEERIALTLRLLATGDEQKSAAFAFRLGFKTVNKIFNETCRAIWQSLKEQYVKAPEKVDDWRKISEEFWLKWQFPLCLGAVDGKHVQVKAPHNSGSEFYNYKGNFSIVLMAISDARYKFTVVDVGGKGSQNDSSTFKASSFGRLLYEEKYDALVLPHTAFLPGTDLQSPHVFIADDAFQLNHHVMKPYSGTNLEYWQLIYNYRLSRARRCIENAFGLLAARWRIFKGPLQAQPQNADFIIKAAIALHNFFIETDASEQKEFRYVSRHMIDYDQSGQIIDGDWRIITCNDTGLMMKKQRFGSTAFSGQAAQIRQNFAYYFCSEEGAVPWQETM